jgi:hypothetical protein
VLRNLQPHARSYRGSTRRLRAAAFMAYQPRAAISGRAAEPTGRASELHRDGLTFPGRDPVATPCRLLPPGREDGQRQVLHRFIRFTVNPLHEYRLMACPAMVARR